MTILTYYIYNKVVFPKRGLKMKFGVGIPTCREGLFHPVGFASVENLCLVTQRAEELGYDSVWGNDHITTQTYVKERGERPNFYEPLIVYSYLSAVTERVKLGTGVIVAPLRNPVIFAKQVSTLDHISRGRLILGLGIGAYREEFEAFGGKGRRGDILDECVLALRALFDKSVASFHGRHIEFSDIELNPKPLQKPFPLYFGGNADAVIKRVGLYGDGWLPTAPSSQELKRGVDQIAQYAREAERDASRIETAPEHGCCISEDSSKARRNFLSSHTYDLLISLEKSTLKDVPSFSDEELVKRNLVGSPDEIIEKLEEYGETGVDHFWFDFIGWKVEEVLEQMELFAREVMPSFK